jgi:hypothetical protein
MGAREYPENIQRIPREYSENTQRIFREYPENTRPLPYSLATIPVAFR